MPLAFVLTALAIGANTLNDSGPSFINSLGGSMVRISAGTFLQGSPDGAGNYDEHPQHKVKVSGDFYLGVNEVTNAQYEEFDPGHRKYRKWVGFSTEDDDPVVYVSWQDANKFANWLSVKEGRPYRLPTEAEWEYAARAATTTPYFTGDTLWDKLWKNQVLSWYPDPAHEKEWAVVKLRTSATPPNPWGLHDMLGNVEEWCYDWYSPYPAGDQTDPVGASTGTLKITRGGSHSTDTFYLRAPSRSATVPSDRSWLLGFRLACGPMLAGKGWPNAELPLVQRNVKQAVHISNPPDLAVPYFAPPERYVNIPAGSNGPLYPDHNHDPAIAECPNGDLLTIWYSCKSEMGRELSIAGSRKRAGSTTWDEASVFWNVPHRNNHAPALWFDGVKTLYHFNGLSAAETWGNLAIVMRKSTDSGATWTPAELIAPEHGVHRQPVTTVFRLKDGRIVLPADATSAANGDTALWIGTRDGRKWKEQPATLGGIHAAVAQLEDGTLLSFGRGRNIDNTMAQSRSADGGKTWKITASPFPPITFAQRAVLLKLRSGALFFASFGTNMPIQDASGETREVTGLFAAISIDSGRSWNHRRLVSDDGPGSELESMDGKKFVMNRSNAEPIGYMAACQTRDGLIHLISSRQHYCFNQAWLWQRPPALN